MKERQFEKAEKLVQNLILGVKLKREKSSQRARAKLKGFRAGRGEDGLTYVREI